MRFLEIKKLLHVSTLGLAILLASLSTQADETAQGKALFASYCESCHGPDGDGNGPAAEAFILKPRAFALAAFKFDTNADWKTGTDQDLTDVIRKGPAVYGGSQQMPGWPSLTDEEIRQLIVYIRSLESGDSDGS